MREKSVEKMFMNDSRTIAQDGADSLRSSDCNAEYVVFCLIGMTNWQVDITLVKWKQNHLLHL